jgi:hypothetical protein
MELLWHLKEINEISVLISNLFVVYRVESEIINNEAVKDFCSNFVKK